MVNRFKIAGVVLTLNEEQDLSRALQSLSWCDELLVLDSGSTDSTQQVAERYQARFIQHRQDPPFLITDQRNWALDHCGLSSDWVLFLDADEEVGTHLVEAIQSRIHLENRFDAYELTPRYWFFGRWLKRTQGYPNWHPRLIRRGATRFEGGVWESFAPDSHVGRISVPYEHYAFSKGFDDWLERHRRYSSWDAEQIVAFLTTRKSSTLATRRWRRMRLFLSQFWWLRPMLRFLQKYVLQAGFLEGWQGFLFALMMAGFDMMTVIKVIELQRKRRNLPL
ncbi:glycosyltransferase family 2 protein [Synechococcus sp. W4D4]|uniref:glycosyltransferase family 2 protein n=1 Tax=Synechococcus sp. W4D4 TaxID=3392294 RepID=UPI0039E8C446